jgi:membrane-bound lytic murein transglycosylase D
MKSNIFISILVLGVQSLFSQDNPNTDTLKINKIIVNDTITGLTKNGDLSTTLLNLSSKDTIIFDLEDRPLTRNIDSTWLNELYNSSRFEEIYGSISEQNYEPVEYEELPTEVLKKRLEELDAKTPFKIEYNPSLESVIKSYLKNRRKTMGKLIALSEYYFPMFEEALDKHDLPLEIKYLAIVESALNPTARSRVGAKGLWQFMFTTGKLFGLEVNSYVDERTDPLMATEAACLYLKSLNETFKDWDLALAAYNSGPGNVSKAIRRSGGKTNYWNIRHNLPRETAGYLPAFLATMYIFEYAEDHGFKRTEFTIPYVATDTIKVKKPITLKQVSRLTNVHVDELTFLNPSYKLGIIPVIKDEDYVLRLPLDALGRFVSNEEAIYAFVEQENNNREKPLPELIEQPDKIRYKVRSGDYLGKIAERYGVGVSQIKRWNGLRSSKLRIGQRLTIYPRKPVSNKNIVTTKTTTTKEGVKIYTVKNGDSLWSISQKFPGVSVKNIKKWNDISGTTLKPGMKLKIQKG